MRYERKQYKKKKKRRWRKLLLILLLLSAGVFAYSYFLFKAGITQSLQKTGTEKVDYEFNGKKDKNGWTNILLIGSDSRGEKHSRADTIMIAHYNKEKGEYKLTSIMRDTYVDIPGYGKNKINAAFAYGGPELLRKTIKENFDIDLQYYSIVDFEGFVQLIDEAFPDGIKVNVEKRMSANIGVTLEPGVQKLDGKHLLGYVRFRHDAVGDFGRVKRQQKVLKILAKELTSLKTIPKLPKLVGVVSPYINTNMKPTTILFMGKDFLSKKNRDFETLRIPVDGSFENQRVSDAGDVLVINLKENRAALKEFLKK
ncbi:LCP family protein [Bacillus methanolicus]|uniref:Regulatory protein MsrR n=1 Tax=Bacillus methanolicus (strain MGA3 / ATCC 53907) TaxID=796606 RepID=A0A068LUW3_BACMM|nr:LCP family protein [Bacillus methanolicus]AIE59287.1 cell envelope-related transcriptional attenuator [Bacillus methanolicus MGA3]